MRVILAQPRGFCAGVVRAIEIVERSLERHGAPVYVRHEIVHNQAVVDGLRSRGAVFVDDLDRVPEDAVTIFSAHGVAREVEADARARRLHVLDATCPLVAKVHVQGRQYAAGGRTVILIGHAGHPEVEGTIGQIDGRVLLVQDEQDVDALDLAPDAPVAYITQTTLSVDDTRGVIAALQRRFRDIVGPDVRDICYATQNRQRAVRELAAQAYVLRKHLAGEKRYPLALMLEPLFRCNLACSGCGKIDYPDEILDQRLSIEECLGAVDECGAPVVSIAGGEPLLHKDMPAIVEGIVKRRKFVYLCTNALLMEKKLDQYKPSPFFIWSVHLDGDRETHDRAVSQQGVYKRAVAAIRRAKESGF